MRISDWSSDVCSSDLIVLYDIDLTLTLPVELSITSGFNAIAHAAEALYAPNGNPLIDGLAEQGITAMRSEEHTSELQSLMRISYAVFCLKKKKQINRTNRPHNTTSEYNKH